MNSREIIELRKQTADLLESNAIQTLQKEGFLTKNRFKKTNKSIPTPYQPKDQHVESLDKIHHIAKPCLSGITPFHVRTRTNATYQLYSILKRLYKPFKEGNIEQMTVETRLDVIERATKGFRKTLRAYRNELVPRHFLIGEEYEENRLHHLSEYHEPPVRFSEADYQSLEEILMKLFETSSHKYFMLTEERLWGNEQVRHMGLGAYVMESFQQALRRFNCLSKSVLKELQSYAIKRLPAAAEDPFFHNYTEYRVKPLSFEMGQFQNRKTPVELKELRNVSNIASHLESLRHLRDDEEVFRICTSLVQVMQLYRDGKIEVTEMKEKKKKTEPEQLIANIGKALPKVDDLLRDVENRMNFRRLTDKGKQY